MSVSALISFFLALGLPGMFAVALFEKFVPVMPSYVMLMFLGMTVSDRGSLVLLVLATVAGSLAGSLGWFALGHKLGERRVESVIARYGKFIFLPLSTYHRLAGAYRRHRFWVTLIGQTVPVARVYLALPAGVLRLRMHEFLPAAILGTLAWNIPFLTLGYILRGSGRDAATVGLWVSIGLVAAEFALMFLIERIRRMMAMRRA